MTIAASIESIKKAYRELGAGELARRSGVPYTTIASLAQRDFQPKSADVLTALENVARAHEQSSA